jgi:hypothetical protein
MKRMLVCLFVVLAVAAAAAAQYVVQEGDNLWNLAGQKLNDPTVWRRIVEMNPFLQEAGRTFTKPDGTLVVIIRPTEVLQGLDALGIIATPEPDPVPEPVPEPEPVTEESGFPWWLLALLLLLAFLAIAYALMRRNPVTVGPAMVPNGVNDNSALGRFATMASGRFAGQSFRIQRIERGRLDGPWTVRYQDGSERTMVLRNEPGYRALLEFPGGRQEELYMLQGCGNDLRFSVLRYVPGLGFSFTPEQDIPVSTQTAPAPAPAAAPAPAVPRQEPAPQPVGANATPTRRSLLFKPAEDGQPNMIKTSGFSEVKFEQNGDEMTLRFS